MKEILLDLYLVYKIKENYSNFILILSNSLFYLKNYSTVVNESISSLTFHSFFRSVIVSSVSPALIMVLPFGTIESSPRLIDTISVFSGK